MNVLAQIQSQVKAPKSQFNEFGKYRYRSCEDICEAVKPIVNKLGYYLAISDEVVEIGGRIYIKATAIISNGSETFQTSAFAREEETKKGMDVAQVSGSASSYARKYALAGLLSLHDNDDPDHLNKHDHVPATPKIPTLSEARQQATKPRITDAQFEALKKRLDAGDTSVINKAMENFMFTQTQLAFLNSKK